ncbi:MAG: DNA-processing protein DprA [Gemmatimonadota bacterium]
MTTIDADDALIGLALACVPGVGPVSVRRLTTEHATVHDAFAAAAVDAATQDRALALARRVRERCADRGIDVLTPNEARYPSTLLDLEDPPAILYSLGRLELVEVPSVALVGARRATPYGLLVARDFARQLAHAGVSIVSGLAMGVDAAAHASALDAHGATVAVQGTGVDVAYPRSNSGLHARLAREGLVLSELPPGRPAHPGAFPRRNRLIAALADVVVVVEAGCKSGALITAQLGGALGRLVAAVPGPIDRETSVGANHLLRDGAHVVASVEDVLALLALTPRGRMRGPSGEARAFHDRAAAGADRAAPTSFPQDSAEGRVLAVLSFGPQGPDELVRACGISPREVGVAIANLVLLAEVDVDTSGLARRRAGSLLTTP